MQPEPKRRVGLSNKANPRRLLQTLPKGWAASQPEAEETMEDKQPAETKEEDILRPPLSSDGESDFDLPPAKGKDGKPPTSSLSSLIPNDAETSNAQTKTSPVKIAYQDVIESSGDEDTPPRGEIKPTSFSKPKRKEGDPFWMTNPRLRGGPNARTKTYAASKKGVSAIGKAGSNASNRKKLIGGKRATANSPKRDKKRAKKEEVEEPKREASPVRLRLPDDSDSSPKKDRKMRSSGLVVPADDSPGKKAAAPALRLLSTSPEKADTKASLNARVLFSSSPEGPKHRSVQLRGLTLSPDAKHAAARPLSLSLKDTEAMPSTQALLNDDLSSELSEPDDQILKELEEETATCPYCNAAVDKDHLTRFSKGNSRMSLRLQRQFCVEHKKRDARTTWQTKRYPEIDWPHLDARMKRHHKDLERILDGEPSHYRDILAEDVKSGKKRNLMKAEFSGSTGYYGARGFRAMQENIFDRFSALLRRKTVEDQLVAARGYSIFVQAVLVPEMAMRLVMDDMDAGAEEARRIMDESAWVGDLLCEDVGDVVNESDEDIF